MTLNAMALRTICLNQQNIGDLFLASFRCKDKVQNPKVWVSMHSYSLFAPRGSTVHCQETPINVQEKSLIQTITFMYIDHTVDSIYLVLHIISHHTILGHQYYRTSYTIPHSTIMPLITQHPTILHYTTSHHHDIQHHTIPHHTCITAPHNINSCH